MAIELRYRVVDVFSDRPLAGNALCVVLDPCPEPVMAAIAREVNLSETTFPVVIAPGEYEMRIFTPAVELPFAGHPSLGTAWVLGPGRWSQHTEGATVSVEADGDGAVMTQPDPELEEVGGEGVADALGLAGVEGVFRARAGGTAHLLVPTSAPLEGLRPDPAAVAALARRLGGGGVAPVRRVDDRTLHVRYFLPELGIAEDPGTGSAAGPIGVLARRLWGTAVDVVVRQGDEIGRPCRIEVHAQEGEVRVGGRVVAAAEGRFTL
ncbi:MAG TPA: PhzF family phenazine biosynthesis protein [Acidimicrobiales bacterium]|nr:PhzF family phenazine biosynthesis protein [Acidimicrobiales bacterium]